VLLALLHLGVAFRALNDLLLVEQNTLSLAALFFGLFGGSFFGWCVFDLLPHALTRVVIRDGAVYCYKKRGRPATWRLDKSLPASAFDTLEISRWYGGEGDFGKAVTLTGRLHSIALYSARGIGSEKDSLWSGNEIKMTEKISRELGNLPITTAEDGLSISGKLFVIFLLVPFIFGDIVGLLYFWDVMPNA